MSLKFAVIKEQKSPPDLRVVLTPKVCKTLLDSHPEAAVVVESSEVRAFSDADLFLDMAVLCFVGHRRMVRPDTSC